MEPVTTLLVCLFATFCAADGTCTDGPALEVTLAFATDDGPIPLWTTPGATGRPTMTDIVEPRPTGPGQPLNLLARTRTDGALLLSVLSQQTDGGPITTTLRRHPDQNGNPTGPEATTAQATCSLAFRAP